MTPQDFFDKYSKVAVNDSLFTDIPPSIKLAQAALESSWGESGLTVNANNFFGIKAYDWSGPVYNAQTHEYYDGSTRTDTAANFRRYATPYESFHDHSKFLNKNARYAKLFDLDFLDYRGWANGLQEAKYATSPTYASKLISIIEKYDLQRYDLKASNQRAVKNIFTALAIIAIVVI